MCGTLYGSLLIFSADSGTDSNTSSKSVRTASNNSNINIINNNNNNNNNKINTLRKSKKLPPKHSKLEFDSKPLAKLKVSNSAIVQVSKVIEITKSTFIIESHTNDVLCRWILVSLKLPYSSTTLRTLKFHPRCIKVNENIETYAMISSLSEMIFSYFFIFSERL